MKRKIIKQQFSCPAPEVDESVERQGTMPKAESVKDNGNFGTGSAGWVKVADLSVGDRIAVRPRPDIEQAFSAKRLDSKKTDIFWDEIVSIRPVGREQVYDIEIEDTHNFVGNGIFAHNTFISGNVGIGVATPVAKLHINDSDEAAFVVTSAGFVGVGTTTPAYKMSVVGDIAATAFVNISTKDSKIDIQYLTGEEEASVLEKIKNTDVATYHYSLESPANPKRLGLIAENAPAEVLSIDGKGVDIYKLSTFTLAGLKALQIRVEDIATRVANLEEDVIPHLMRDPDLDSGSSAGMTGGIVANIYTVAKSVLSGIVSTIGDWANSALAETSKLFVASENETDKTYRTYDLQGSREEIQISGTATLVMLPADPLTGLAPAGARIKFDESFSAVISETELIKVIVTPTTRLNGSLYVHQKTRFGFEIREINAQDEGGMFDWIVIARKKGAEENVIPAEAGIQNLDSGSAEPSGMTEGEAGMTTEEPVAPPPADSSGDSLPPAPEAPPADSSGDSLPPAPEAPPADGSTPLTTGEPAVPPTEEPIINP